MNTTTCKPIENFLDQHPATAYFIFDFLGQAGLALDDGCTFHFTELGREYFERQWSRLDVLSGRWDAYRAQLLREAAMNLLSEADRLERSDDTSAAAE